MLLRTHLASAIFIILIFFNYINNKTVFALMVIIGAIIPDLDTKNSDAGKYLILRPFQAFIKHRGILHSLTFAIILTAIFLIFWPVGALGFFIGITLHLLLDTMTKSGIKLFWPFNLKFSGPLKTGGVIDELLFISLIIANSGLIFYLLINI